MRKNQKVLYFAGIAFILLCINLSALPGYGTGDGGLSISFRRNFGIGLGDYVQGKFTVTGTAPDSIVNLSLTFNGEEVLYVEGNDLSFQFHTDDFPPGETDITLFGWDSEGQIFSESEVVNILEPVWALIIGIVTGVIVVVAFFLKYGKYFRRKKGAPGADQVKIDKL